MDKQIKRWPVKFAKDKMIPLERVETFRRCEAVSKKLTV